MENNGDTGNLFWLIQLRWDSGGGGFGTIINECNEATTEKLLCL